jgi:hypothetical protein
MPDPDTWSQYSLSDSPLAPTTSWMPMSFAVEVDTTVPSPFTMLTVVSRARPGFTRTFSEPPWGETLNQSWLPAQIRSGAGGLPIAGLSGAWVSLGSEPSSGQAGCACAVPPIEGLPARSSTGLPELAE